MELDDLRFSLYTAENYIQRHNVLVYIEDAISQLLEHREENPKGNTPKFFSDYFNTVREGNHVLFREYAYVKATRHNRASFVQMFWKCFKHIGRKGDLLSIKEYHALVGLLCPDFPFNPIQKTGRIILMHDALNRLVSFSDFLFAFQIQFCFDEFMTKCAEAYQIIQDAPPQSPHTPAAERAATEPQPNPDTDPVGPMCSDGIDSIQFYRVLIPLCERLDLHAPPIDLLKEILLAVKRITFFAFLMALANSQPLNESIGKLPPKSQLLDVCDQENALPPLRPTSSKNRPKSAQSRLISPIGVACGNLPEVDAKSSNRVSRSQTTTTAVSTASTSSLSTLTHLGTIMTSQKAVMSRNRPTPRHIPLNVVASEDDEDEEDDEDDSESPTN